MPSRRSSTHLIVDSQAAIFAGAPSTEYGFLVGANTEDGNGGIALTINASGQWRVQLYKAGETSVELHGWSESPALNQGTSPNQLSVAVVRESVYFLANGEVLWERHDLSTSGEFWGFFTRSTGGGDVCFNALRTEILPATPPDDRGRFLTEFGQPDTFVVLFEETEDGSLVRREEWAYNDELTVLTFLDGVLVNDETIERSEAVTFGPAALYRPLDFQPGMSFEQIKTLLGNTELVEMEVLPELGGNYRLYGARQIMIGFSDGKLLYVETLALTAGEEVTP